MWRGKVLARVCLLSLVSTVALCADERGWLLGSAAFIGKQFLGNAAKAKFTVACRGKRATIQTDANGDYAVRLDACEYQLESVVGADGKELRLHSKQAKTFVITGGGTTRFDLMIRR